MTTKSSNVTLALPVFEIVRVAVDVPPIPLLKQLEVLCVVVRLLREIFVVVAEIGEIDARLAVSVCLIGLPLLM